MEQEEEERKEIKFKFEEGERSIHLSYHKLVVLQKVVKHHTFSQMKNSPQSAITQIVSV
jgi:hypothetical protein